MLPSRRRGDQRYVTSGLEMMDQHHRSKSSIESAVSAGNLNLTTTVSDIPGFLVTQFHIIRPPIENGRSLIYDIRGVTYPRAGNNNIYRHQDPEEELLKSLAVMVHSSASGGQTALMIYISMLCIIDTEFQSGITTLLMQAHGKVNTVTLYEFLELYPVYQACNPFNVEHLRSITPHHWSYLLGLTSNLIGKNLNSTNYQEWMIRRNRSFAAPLVLLETDKLLPSLRPSAAFCRDLYAQCRVNWAIRRKLFIEIYALSRQRTIISVGMQVTLGLLQHSELTDLNMILLWIVTLNPYLLFWKELAKYLPFIVAAYRKYSSIGKYAPWCKLFLPQEELSELASDKLKIPYSVARAIAAHYGSNAVSLTEGASTQEATEAIIRDALYIVRVAGGIRNVDIMALRQWRYAVNKNTRRVQALDTGAVEDKEETVGDEQTAGVEERMGRRDSN